MKKFFRSGGAFMVVALLCMVTGPFTQNPGIFIIVGSFWVIMGFIVRAKYADKSSADKENHSAHGKV
jgi:hypothetical protein